MLTSIVNPTSLIISHRISNGGSILSSLAISLKIQKNYYQKNNYDLKQNVNEYFYTCNDITMVLN